MAQGTVRGGHHAGMDLRRDRAGLPDALDLDAARRARLPRVLARAEARRRGLSPRAIEHRLATGRWFRILPAVYLTSDTLTWPDRLEAALAYAGPGAVLTGAAALADLGLRSVSRPHRILVLAPRSATACDRDWVRIRRTNRLPAPADGLTPARAPVARGVADLALELHHLDDVRALVTQALRARLCRLDDLARELDEGPQRGSAHLRVALADAAAGAWSAPEARAASILRRAHVPPFVQNAVITVAGQRYIVDFLWPQLRAVLEIDSQEHHLLRPADLERTQQRHLVLEAAGHSVAHYAPALIRRDAVRFQRLVEAWLDGLARRRA